MQWELKKYLLEFNSPVRQHTSNLIGQDLVATMKKFHVEKKVHGIHPTLPMITNYLWIS
jgi:hypothetical protein